MLKKERIQKPTTGLYDIPPIEDITVLHRNDSDRIIDELKNQEEGRQYNILVDDLHVTQNRIELLQEINKNIDNELLSISYPKHALFGFISFIVFAILGVIIPMTYGAWIGVLQQLSQRLPSYPILENANHIIVILFVIGLSINFLYILLEVHPALKRPNMRKSRNPQG